jgi:hypothetical protein
LNLIWLAIVEEGSGAFVDRPKYRKTMSDWIWRGVAPEVTDEERAEQKAATVESARAAIGAPAPADALAEAKALRDRLRGSQPASTD